MSKDRYFVYVIFAGEKIEREVTKEEYCRSERRCGFYPKCNSPDTPATSAFSSEYEGGRIEGGRIEYANS